MRVIYNDSNGLQNGVIQTFIDIYDMFPEDKEFYKIDYDKTHIVEESSLYSIASSELERLKSLGRADLYVFLDSVILRKESSIVAFSILDYKGVEAYSTNKTAEMPSIHDQEFALHLDELKSSIFIDAFCGSLRELMRSL